MRDSCILLRASCRRAVFVEVDLALEIVRGQGPGRFAVSFIATTTNVPTLSAPPSRPTERRNRSYFQHFSQECANKAHA
eukprot:6203395-Pleurochrysis_carterae.AAC.4